MRSPSQTNTWEYWIPGWSQILQTRDLFSGNFGDGFGKMFGVNSSDTGSLASDASAILGNAREEFLSDREHTEMREDNAVQRLVEDYRKAGLNPATISASPQASSSSVGSDTIGAKIQMLGYLLDLKNLDAKNRKITNDAIGNVLSIFKKK